MLQLGKSVVPKYSHTQNRTDQRSRVYHPVITCHVMLRTSKTMGLKLVKSSFVGYRCYYTHPRLHLGLCNNNDNLLVVGFNYCITHENYRDIVGIVLYSIENL